MNHIYIEQKEFCTGCTACSNVCPQQCISFLEDEEGFLYPNVDESFCVECGKCKAVCPVKKERGDIPDENNIKVFACVNKDKKVLKESSSGGVFSLLAQKTIEKGGVVFGAAFNECWDVCHISITDSDEIFKFRGSKYVQSNMGDAFSSVKNFLNQGRQVLFSGTPCQIAGLNSYLGREYTNLVTCDFICTGVPSPKVFRAYRTHYERKFQEPILKISFRDKKYGWDAFSMVLCGTSKEYRKIRFFDPYIQAQYSHISLRPACYHCQFKKCNSNSDIKLADYWYVSQVHPEIAARDGVSLVIINGPKGQKLFDSVAPEMQIVESQIEHVYRTNASFAITAKEPVARKEYLQVVCHSNSSEDIVRWLEKHAKLSFKDKIVTRLRFFKHQMFTRK
ncbi:Coenzyme F420 hydrogenase/dehydrogenase, beta subunit C-terminal domain [Bittarella massiliensis (ex Durand et al. 2017)]|uniref:Coenzyme F420 hydrogenase/dehydrogenase, beta subunit C-terminal domain n=1 Tax=Bittarella massiliensis (ex Durand et al. 2017) TaxID=1720313 RepID=A0AAW5KBL6_9FIRM|nr:Coenzyme F420 hydrogenase/dehydrogenase, beta subunit C-terminal domain [Bittarella massiliensis (ex Durand et al. 2017)]